MKGIIIIAPMFSAFTLLAQEREIKSMLKDYFSLLKKKEISKALDHVHPDLINMLGKSTSEKQYNELFNSPGVHFDLVNFSIDTLSPMHTQNDMKYVLVDYSFLMTFKDDISNDESGLLPDTLLSSYQTNFGKENVTSETPGTYLVQLQREMFAVQNPSSKDWKIIDFEEDMRIMIVGIIPDEVLKHFNR